jgi:hypothetical protein
MKFLLTRWFSHLVQRGFKVRKLMDLLLLMESPYLILWCNQVMKLMKLSLLYGYATWSNGVSRWWNSWNSAYSMDMLPGPMVSRWWNSWNSPYSIDLFPGPIVCPGNGTHETLLTQWICYLVQWCVQVMELMKLSLLTNLVTWSSGVSRWWNSWNSSSAPPAIPRTHFS